jgi:hypothetical protein
LPFNIGNQAEIDEMMMAFVAPLAAVFLGQLDAVPLHSVDGAYVNTVRSDNFHMLFDFACVRHDLSSLEKEATHRRNFGSFRYHHVAPD